MKPRKLWYEMFDPADPVPTSAKTHVPQWYKDSERFIGGKPVLHPEANSGLKLCAPFLDALTTGYCLNLPYDLLVEQNEEGPYITWRGKHKPLTARNGTYRNHTLPTPVGFSETHFAWNLNVSLRLEDGYSALVTHPLNRMDLPFYTLSGVVDLDWDMYGGSLPFFISNVFEGIIERGTPIAQIIPFKREDWKAEHKPGLQKAADINLNRSLSVISGWYKQGFWKRKTYE
jgi:hypothetical protein